MAVLFKCLDPLQRYIIYRFFPILLWIPFCNMYLFYPFHNMYLIQYVIYTSIISLSFWFFRSNGLTLTSPPANRFGNKSKTTTTMKHHPRDCLSSPFAWTGHQGWQYCVHLSMLSVASLWSTEHSSQYCTNPLQVRNFNYFPFVNNPYFSLICN